jgi:hypothetical protein
VIVVRSKRVLQESRLGNASKPVVKPRLHSTGDASPPAALLLPQILPDILSRRALPAGRLAGLCATPEFHHGLLGLTVKNQDVLGTFAPATLRRISSCQRAIRRSPACELVRAKADGGESGIRTHGRVSPTHAFQACSIDRSDISPFRINHLRAVWNSIAQNLPSRIFDSTTSTWPIA